MNSKILKSGHIKLYKRENSQFWQMKLKLPKLKSIRSSTGSKILKEAESIAIKYYSTLRKKTNININRKKNIFKKIHLVETSDLNKKEIEHILYEAKKYILYNKKRNKKLISLKEGQFLIFFLKTLPEHVQVLKLQLKD